MEGKFKNVTKPFVYFLIYSSFYFKLTEELTEERKDELEIEETKKALLDEEDFLEYKVRSRFS